MIKHILSILLSVATLSVCAQKANNNKLLLDGIVAVVGNSIILKSDIEGRIMDIQKDNPNTPLPKDISCLLLRNMIQTKALALQAAKDSIQLSEDEVEQNLDYRVKSQIYKYGSKEEVEKIIGRPIYQFKEDMRADVRESILADRVQGSIIRNVRITPSEVEAYFKRIPVDSLRYKESEYEINQLVFDPKASKENEEKLLKQLSQWKSDVENGKANFSELAKKNSDEPAAKQTGGQINLNKDIGGIDPTFMTAAFKLKEGQISPPVKTSFGYHIIQMVSKVGNEAVVRHIIKMPPIGDTEVRAAIEMADSVRNIIIDKNIPFNTAVNRYSDDENMKYTGGAVVLPMGGGSFKSVLTIDELPDKEMATAITKMKVGDISEAQLFQNPQNYKLQVRLLYLRSKTEPHRENLKDDYNEIAQRALQIKQQEVLSQWIEKNIGKFYIKIDPSYDICPKVKEWTILSEKNLNHFISK